jgi:hypothetical protein
VGPCCVEVYRNKE